MNPYTAGAIGSAATFMLLWSMAVTGKPKAPRAATCDRRVFPAQVLRVIDGDTFEARVDLGMGISRQAAVRVMGVDTPEVHGPHKNREPVRGAAATDFTRRWAAEHGDHVWLTYGGEDKYGGRIDARVRPPGGGPSLDLELRAAGFQK